MQGLGKTPYGSCTRWRRSRTIAAAAAWNTSISSRATANRQALRGGGTLPIGQNTPVLPAAMTGRGRGTVGGIAGLMSGSQRRKALPESQTQCPRVCGVLVAPLRWHRRPVLQATRTLLRISPSWKSCSSDRRPATLRIQFHSRRRLQGARTHRSRSRDALSGTTGLTKLSRTFVDCLGRIQWRP